MAEGKHNRPEMRKIKGFSRYLATSDGRIIGAKGFALKPYLPKDGYPQVTVSDDNGKQTVKKLHLLICVTFHGPRPSKSHEAAHWNGIRADCSAKNLRWATRRENRDDMKRHGTWPKGDVHPRAQITQAQADEIRALHASEMGVERVRRGFRLKMAKRYGVGVSLIKDVLAGRCWNG